jgi:urease accessory protein UreE
MELEERLVVEDHPVERRSGRLGQAEADGVRRERGVVLDSGEALLLGGRDDLAVVDQAGGRVVVVAADSQDLQNCLS